ncbi:trypsin inhibitor like cysteine rich domain-containing protein [Ditylenchus destructor]|uniref:Trypsin inhibitor like cysteine rich domain-containing protein n=1 Tax=Ditylenchus destructor TaxID=166010 RepID=A0AAD4MVB3_9BILA|nr:trypsin inhibitor like cysteine rich domain-containing protein [Ditylenchus destructor]
MSSICGKVEMVSFSPALLPFLASLLCGISAVSPRDPAVKFPICAENEVYENGSACEPNCEDPEGKRDCTKDLVEKCRCLPGFVRHDGKCVPLSHCPRSEPPSCGENEKYAECGKQCEPSCDHPKPSCVNRCVKGCLCLPGFLRHPSGKCVPLSYCPEPKPECPQNETNVERGSRCEELTCKSANSQPFKCRRSGNGPCSSSPDCPTVECCECSSNCYSDYFRSIRYCASDTPCIQRCAAKVVECAQLCVKAIFETHLFARFP